MRGGITYLSFVLLFALILVVYYVGASTDFLAFARGAQQIMYALSGRNAAGNFTAPSGYGAGGVYDPFR